jgi:hypothetical protein
MYVQYLLFICIYIVVSKCEIIFCVYMVVQKRDVVRYVQKRV